MRLMTGIFSLLLNNNYIDQSRFRDAHLKNFTNVGLVFLYCACVMPQYGTLAEFAYIHRSLAPTVDGFLKRYTHYWYQKFLEKWKIELNHYLSSGTKPPE